MKNPENKKEKKREEIQRGVGGNSGNMNTESDFDTI